MTIEVVFRVLRRRLSFFVRKIRPSIIEAGDERASIVGVLTLWEKEDDVVAPNTFVEPIYRVKVHERTCDGMCQTDPFCQGGGSSES